MSDSFIPSPPLTMSVRILLVKKQVECFQNNNNTDVFPLYVYVIAIMK